MSERKKTTPRARAIAIIHIAAKQLSIAIDDGDDESGQLSSYRLMLKNLTGKTSTGKMSPAEHQKVIDHLKQKGFKIMPNKRIGKHPGTPHTISREPQLKKIEALLAEANRPWAYAVGMAKHMYRRERLEFCDASELRGIITALMKNAKKDGRYVE